MSDDVLYDGEGVFDLAMLDGSGYAIDPGHSEWVVILDFDQMAEALKEASAALRVRVVVYALSGGS